ncbi:MAG: type II toxin-antitoxin system prevent-host-death family antitoxin [Gemmatimonadota bacterium]
MKETPKETMAISKFKATCLAVLERVGRTGEPVLITRFGEPVAEVVPPRKEPVAGGWLGSMSDRGRVVGDVILPATDPSEWEALGLAPPR